MQLKGHKGAKNSETKATGKERMTRVFVCAGRQGRCGGGRER